MKNNETNTHPIIVIGPRLKEMYNAMCSDLKKRAAFAACIDPSNMSACLNPQRNICKNSLRKIATGLNVYPIMFYLTEESIKSEFLEYDGDEGIVHVENYKIFLELCRLSLQNKEHSDVNNQLLSEIENMFATIDLGKENNLSEDEIKQELCAAISGFSHSLSERFVEQIKD